MRAAEPGLTWPADEKTVDERVFLRASWADYQRINRLRGESAVPRLVYQDGVLELMSPGEDHETDKKKLARLFEVHVDHLGVLAEGVGSWTVKNQRRKLGAEADECYLIGRLLERHKTKAPDLVIEVVYSSGGLSKLEVWYGLGAKEVWFWTRKRELLIFVRRPRGWRASSTSALVPDLDPALLVRCMAVVGQTAAVAALRKALQRR
ncbi:MAG TPA: Uma2 family endonuclease [Kofleriaceae bacterium]|nr:Uma2 family endonuclease [Kofleriaceae bacterium]